MKRSFADILQGLDSDRAQKIARKLPAWAAVDGLEIPSALSLEQCSSSATADYKASLARQAVSTSRSGQLPPETSGYAGPLPLPAEVGPSLLRSRPGRQDPPKRGCRGLEDKPACWLRFPGAVPASVPPETAPGFAAALPVPAENNPINTVLDLTGGLGVDSWAFSQVAERVVYFERNAELAAAAGRNFARLGAGNIEVRCEEVTPQTDLPEADLIYADPARRDAAGRKVFLLEDCTPDILTLLPMLLRKAPTVLLKLSPMADLAMLADRLDPALREIHVVELDGEVKEILCLLCRQSNFHPLHPLKGDCTQSAIARVRQRATSEEPNLVIVRLSGQAAATAKLRASRYPSQPDGWAPSVHEATGGHGFAAAPPAPDSDLRFRLSEERAAEVKFAAEVQPGDVLLEPCPALLKAGAFRLPCTRWGLLKLAPSTHLYLLPAPSAPGTETPSSVPGEQKTDVPGTETPHFVPGNRFFKGHTVKAVCPLGAAAFKTLRKSYPRAEVTARNLPLTTEALRKKLGVAPGGEVHIFGCRLADGSSVLIVCSQTR